ncbi:MAG: hypothetical protein HOV79_03300 [Hamadaea sp.]|nr:hypothetical protein [Hamadaea sp.]
MSGLWRTVWATGQDLPRMIRLVRPGPVLALSAGGDEREPYAVVVTGQGPAAAAGDRLHAWDIASGGLTSASVDGALCVAVGSPPDGTMAVTGHADGTVQVWSVPDLTPLRSWHTGRHGVEDVVTAGPVGAPIIVTLGADGAVTRWSPETGEPLGGFDTTASLAICSGRLVDGRDVVVTGGRGVSLWDVHSGRRLPLPIAGQETLGGVAAVLLSARDHRDLLTLVTGARELVTFDVATGEQRSGRVEAHADDFPPHLGRMWGGKRARPRAAMIDGIVAVPTKWRIHFWDPAAGVPSAPGVPAVSVRPPLPGPVRKPVLATVRWQGRDRLLTGSAEDGVVGLWDPDPPARPSTGYPHEVARLALAAPGVVVCADEGGTVAAHRTEDGTRVALPTGTGVRGVVSLAAWTRGTGVRAATGAGSADESHPWLQRWDLVRREEMPSSIKVSVPQLRHLGMATVGGEDVLVVVDRELLQLRRAEDGTLVDEVRRERGTYRLVTGIVDGDPVAVVSAIGRPPEVVRLEQLSAPPSPVAGLDGGFVAAVEGTRLVAGSLAQRRSGWRTVWACDLAGRPVGPEIVGAPIAAVAIAAWPATFIARADATISLTDLESGRDLCPALHLPAEPRTIATDRGDLIVGVGTDLARFTPPVGGPG